MANDFLPHATGGGANVITQSAWAALAARLTGFQAGTAKSNEINKALRQSTSMAAMIGEFINTYGSLDALDNADIAALMLNFARAYQAQKPNYVGALGGTANALTANLAPAPVSWAAVIGTPIRLLIASTNTGAATLNLNGLGAKNIIRSDGNPLQSGDLPSNRIVEVIYDGTSVQLVGRAPSQSRTLLIANLNLYVNPASGSDSNNGLTSGTAFQSLQKAWDTVANRYDLNGFTVTVNCADGTYTTGVRAFAPPLGSTAGVGAVKFLGNTSTPGNCFVQLTSGGQCFYAQGGAQLTVDGFKVQSTGSNGLGLVSGPGGVIAFQRIWFLSCALAHVSASGGGFIQAIGPYTIYLGSQYHVTASQNGVTSLDGVTVTLDSLPAFTAAFAQALSNGTISAVGYLQTGGATGVRYSVVNGGAIYVAGAGPNALPGNAAGGNDGQSAYS